MHFTSFLKDLNNIFRLGFRKFLLIYILLVSAVALIFWALDSFLLSQSLLIPYFWLVYGYMASITVLVYGVSIIGIKMGGDHQSAILLSAIVLRLLLTLCFILFYIVKIRVDAVLFIVNFFSIYLFFTVFEIYCLLCNLRHQIKK